MPKHIESTEKRGFTLIELLVVIAIIAILAAILFPVFAQAKLMAKKATDLSNMKQVGTATIMYITDSDDAFPLVEFASDPYNGQTSYRWSSSLALGPYIKNTAIFTCPLDPSGPYTLPFQLLPASRNAVIAKNSLMANALSPAWFVPGYFPPTITRANARGIFGAGNYYVGSSELTSATQTQIQAGSQTIMYAGGAVQAMAQKAVDCVGQNGPNTEITRCGYEDLISAYDVMNLILGSYFGYPDPILAFGWTKFFGGSNFVFADTSAKTLKPGALLQGAFLDPNRFLINPNP